MHAYFNPQIERAISAFTSQPRNITTLWIFVGLLISTYCMVNTTVYVVDYIGRRCMQWFSSSVHSGLGNHPVAWIC